MEYELFKKCVFDYSKLLNYGFKKENNIYYYEKYILDNNYKICIKIENNNVIGKIYDLIFNDEYLNLNVDSNLSFNNKIKEEYIKVLKDIKVKCTKESLFVFKQSNEITSYIKRKYKVNPEFLWKKNPNNGVFRNKNNKKWFGIIISVSKNKLDLKYKQEEIEVINLKLDEKMIKELIKMDGFYMAYHMNKKSWISIILDNTLDNEIIYSLIDQSYNNVNK